ncbi:hypothetical protein N431DRAFT_430109 [Stipitochalara longipes BDJ]|nr:hypothetical protein N431DRAFT_430109 [Stipitochalara longipes BDJ]
MGAYDALDQQDRDAHDSDVNDHDSRSAGSASPTPPPPPPHRSYTRYRRNLGGPSDRIKNRNAAPAKYSMIEADDFEEGDIIPVASLTGRKHSSPTSETFPLELKISRPRPRRPCSPAHSATATAESTFSSRSIALRPVLRTASGRSVALRHPTPDLQTLQGAYTSNIEHLEKTAERLSMTSSIEDAIKELHDQQKRSDSRRSSLLSSLNIPAVSRQVSNASSIVEVNSTARSGGFSPTGYIMSPGGSFTTGSGRGHSMSKRIGPRPEPELEGRPLDSFVNMDASLTPISPAIPGLESFAVMNEESSAMTKPILDLLESPDLGETFAMPNEEQDQSKRSASVHTYEEEGIFEDFDGVHSAPIQERTVSGHESNNSNDTQGRPSSGNRLSMARPKSYADPSTGEEMVYYPAPVPMMLNLPQKLSKIPSPVVENKRRSQVLSSISPTARQSAIWLPDVLQGEDAAGLAKNDAMSPQEYIPQHQRASMGGRRLTQDLSHMPAQLRASTFFELPPSNQTIEVKEQSAVATLDSILDASASAPVTAFTDHAFAGRVGAEVYGREPIKHSRTSTALAEPSKKRNSAFNIFFRGRRKSSANLLDEDEGKRATMSGVVESKVRSPIEDGEEDDQVTSPLGQSNDGEGEEDEELDQSQGEEEIFNEAPNTLLAELQQRKQQQKLRTRPLLTAFPNGMHSTLLEMDAVAQVEQKSRKQKRVNLAWEDPAPAEEAMEDDEETPLGILYAKKDKDFRDPTRPMGLMERREMEDNEPLSRRRDRLQGRQPMRRAPTTTTMHILLPQAPEEEEAGTLTEHALQLNEQAAVDNGLPSARPVSGDFTSELMSQFGGDLLDVKDTKGKEKEISTSPGPEEEETLGQRRKRLQAERAAREKEVGAGAAAGDTATAQRNEINKRRSMANILQVHPAAGASRNLSYERPIGGLLGLHEKASAQRSSTMLDLNTSGAGLANGRRKSSSALRNYNDGQVGIVPPPQQQPGFIAYGNQPTFPQPSLGRGNPAMWGGQMFANPYAVGYPGMPMGYMPGMPLNGMPMNGMHMAMGMGMQPLNQGQIDMVEQWRQSVMQ